MDYGQFVATIVFIGALISAFAEQLEDGLGGMISCVGQIELCFWRLNRGGFQCLSR